jgi:hypothetical protein
MCVYIYICVVNGIYIHVKMKIDFDMMYSYNISYIFVIYKMIGNILCIVRIYMYIDIYT